MTTASTTYISSFICDAPARAWLKGIVNHTGFHSCERCTILGDRVHNRSVFNEREDVEPRTWVDFRSNSYSHGDHPHQRSETPLVELGFDLIKGFSLDYKHLVCLGAVRRMLHFLRGDISGTNDGKLSAGMLTLISSRLMNFKMPTEFARQPRSLSHLDRWKATELRSFLLFTGIVALKGIVYRNV